MNAPRRENLMPIDHIDDWEKRIERHDAFWEREIIDRPLVHVTVTKDDAPPIPTREHASLRDRWLDAEFVAEKSLNAVERDHFLGDALPKAHPNLGPEVFSAYFGLEMEYGEKTSWSEPNLPDWSDVDSIQFSEDNVYWRKTLEMTQALLEIGENKFYTGFTDLHPGGDAIAAFRDPVNLNMDMIDHAEEVKALLDRITDDYINIYDRVYDILIRHRQAITTWFPICSTKKWYVPSNDFSCMISKEMFDDVFLPGIQRECQFHEASVYHLDGPDALRHLDSLLAIDELNAIQFVIGAGNGRPTEWFHVFKKIQDAGKGISLAIQPEELPAIMENLRPEGVFTFVSGVNTAEEGEAIVKAISKWR